MTTQLFGPGAVFVRLVRLSPEGFRSSLPRSTFTVPVLSCAHGAQSHQLSGDSADGPMERPHTSPLVSSAMTVWKIARLKWPAVLSSKATTYNRVPDCQSAPKFGPDSISMKFAGGMTLFSERNQHHANQF
jgi:hypothetical protein